MLFDARKRLLSCSVDIGRVIMHNSRLPCKQPRPFVVFFRRKPHILRAKPMRIEATLPESRAEAADQLAEQLGLSRSQVIDEALALFVKVVLEVRKGRRVVSVEPGGNGPACELSTPSVTMLEWNSPPPIVVKVTPAQLERIEALNREPPEPTENLRKAYKRYRRLPPDRSTEG